MPPRSPFSSFTTSASTISRSLPFFLSDFFKAACLSAYLLHLLTEHVYSVAETGGPSMLATLSAHGDCVLISRYYRRGRDIQVGDVVNYKHPLFPWMGAIKRVGGMPGDLVCRGGQKGEGGRMIQVPEGHCWLLGDNLPDSRDSRIYGPVPLALVNGKVIARVWPWRERKWIENSLQRPEVA